MTKPATPRVGDTMLHVLRYIADNPGCTQQQAAIAAGPHGMFAS